MATLTASGSSGLTGTSAATEQAIKQALGALAAKGPGAAVKPTLGFVFVGPKHKVDVALAVVAREMTGGADVVGCTTAGEITEQGLTHGGVAVMLIASDDLVYDLAATTGVKANHEKAAAALCARFNDTATAAKARGYVASTTVTLVDGLAGTGEKLVSCIMKGTRSFQQVVGGAAGDEGKFEATPVGASWSRGKQAGPDGAVAVHLFGQYPVGVGVDHGLHPSTPRMVVTRAAGNVVYELDNEPAFEVYKRFAREKGVNLTPQNAGNFLINNELGVFFFSRLQHARAPLSVGTDGSLSCAADIPEGANVTILDGKRDQLVSAAKNAAEEAREHLGGREAAGILLFDCVCRGAILEKDFQREIDAVRSVFPRTPIAGFLTYGEIARYRGRLDGWHNTTAVVAAIPA